MHWDFFDWLARWLSSVYRRRNTSWPLGESRLDREAKRVELGCAVAGLLLLGLLLYLGWRAGVLF